MMRIIRAKDYDDMSRKAAAVLAAQVTVKPDCVLGLATGSTPIGTYDCLAKWCSEGVLDFSRVSTVNLDEYRGLDHANDQSYYYFMNKNLFSRSIRSIPMCRTAWSRIRTRKASGMRS